MPLHPRRTVLPGVVALVLLLAAAPRPGSALALLTEPGTATDPTEPLVAAAALAAWALALWLGVTVAVVLAARAPGLAGRAAAACGRRVAPVAVRRTLEVALGLTVGVAATAGPATAASGPPSGAATSVGASSAALPSLDWPDPSRSATTPTAAPSPAPAQAHAPSQHEAPPVEAPSPAAPPARTPSGAAAAPAAVVVAPGDSLWALAEAHLERTGTASPTDRQVAAAWPLWWSANRDVVGDDPDLIHPGTVLQPPQA